jgi:hypothetical protein
MKTGSITLGFAVAVVVVVIQWAQPVQAQPRGQVFLTQTAPPTTQVSPARLYRFIRKHRVYTLRQIAGERFWRVYLFAQLRMAPTRALLNLSVNGGRVHLAYYRKVRRRWVRDNVDDVVVKPGVRFMRISYKMDSSLGLTKGAQYQLRVTLLNRRGREIVLAVGHFMLK